MKTLQISLGILGVVMAVAVRNWSAAAWASAYTAVVIVL